MQIGEQCLPPTQPLSFGRQRLLDLHDQLGSLKHLRGIGRNLGTGLDVFRI
jgi:hypothetical protein